MEWILCLFYFNVNFDVKRFLPFVFKFLILSSIMECWGKSVLFRIL